jgi:hypothetical protein
MNKEKQRIAIAEACGWTCEYADVQTWNAGLNSYKGGYEPIRTMLFRRREKCFRAENLPDYLADLNAMHEAEKMMTEDQWLSYTIEVLMAAKDGTFVIDRNMKTIAHATAAQRAEAFLKTIGKWEDDK